MAELYSESFINSCTAKEWEARKSELSGILNTTVTIWLKEGQVKCLRLFKKRMSRGINLLYSLDPFFYDHLQPLYRNVKPAKGELLAELKKTIDSLQIDENSQEFAFRYYSLSEIYNKRIVLKGKFEFIREDSSSWSPTQRGRLFYDLILPFEKRTPPTGRCFETKELPKFYRYQS